MVEKATRRSSTGKVYYQISEVAQLTGVNESTLRNWEEQYEELRNVRRINNRRHYTAADIASIERINAKRARKETTNEAREVKGSRSRGSKPAEKAAKATEQETLTKKQVRDLVKSLREVKEELRKIASQLA